MKEGFDKEIDSLLGRYARGAAKSFAGGDGAAVVASSHLDADELGAFAEGALPPPARLAAASHLADCDRCRGVVVALSRALGGGAELKQAAAVPPSTETEKPAAWRAWVAALFSPRVLRFAAPMLALSVVAVVSFVALRSRNAGSMDSTMNARPQTETSKSQPNTGTDATAGASSENREGLVSQNTEDASRKDVAARAPSQPPSPTGRGPNVGEAQPEAPAATADETSAPPPPMAARPEEVPVEIAKAAPKTAAVEESEQPSKSEERNKEKSGRGADQVDDSAAGDLAAQQRARVAQNRANNIQMPDGGSRDQKRSADNNTSNIYGGNAGTSAPPSREAERDARGGGAATVTRRPRPPARAEQRPEDNEAGRVGETREAAGHRFRREGSVWFDVKYKSSMPSTGVRRGTEAFRALVADVPVVGRVAEQIGGEVVVVVSGRAYRIR